MGRRVLCREFSRLRRSALVSAPEFGHILRMKKYLPAKSLSGYRTAQAEA